MSDSTPHEEHRGVTTPGSELLPVIDTPPKSGVFVDHDDEPLTEDDIALGNALGQVIDVDDDDDRDGGLL